RAAPPGLARVDTVVGGALYGDRALTALAPRFAREAGLTGRGGTTEHEVPRPGCGTGGISCGGV
ncbi:hypothetical protein ACFW2E_27750, partial [Streptomyces sp. NPDC058964]